MKLTLMVLLFAIVNTNFVGIAYGIGSAQENANANKKGNTQGTDNAQGITYAEEIDTVNQVPGIPPHCCHCKQLLPCCPCKA